jgi:hypothetical protein
MCLLGYLYDGSEAGLRALAELVIIVAFRQREPQQAAGPRGGDKARRCL